MSQNQKSLSSQFKVDVTNIKFNHAAASSAAAAHATIFSSTPLASTGPHTVYMIFEAPRTPWDNAYNNGDNKANAWVTALDFAINTASAKDKTTANTALSAITQYLHSGHGLTYDTDGGSPGYASSSRWVNFDLSGYIVKSSTAVTNRPGNVVNCYDQAAAVSVFGRCLGVNVTYSFMNPFGYINQVNLVGEGNCNNPFHPFTTSGKIANDNDVMPKRSSFGNHAFATFGGYVFDACAGPETGTRTEAQYISTVIDTSTTTEANAAGSLSDIVSGNVLQIK